MNFNHHYAGVGLRAIAQAMEASDPAGARALRVLALEVAEQHETQFCLVGVAKLEPDETTSEDVARAAGALLHSPDPKVRRVAGSALTQAKPKRRKA